MRYVKKWCPNCKYIIQPRTSDSTYGMVQIGIPFIICPRCGTMLIQKNIKETNMLTKIDYVRIWSWNILNSLFVGFIAVLIFAIPIGFVFRHTEQFEFFLGISFCVIFLIVTLLFFKKCYRITKKELKESKERLKDKKYKEITEQIKKDFYSL